MGLAADQQPERRGILPRAATSSSRTNEEIVTDRYFETMGLKIIDGRVLPRRKIARPARATPSSTPRWRAASFPDQSAVGKRWDYGDSIGKNSAVIVGVVEDATLRRPEGRAAEHGVHAGGGGARRGAERHRDQDVDGAPRALAQTVRETLARVEPRLPIVEVVAARGSARPRRHPGPHGRAPHRDVRRAGAAARLPRPLWNDFIRHQPPRRRARAAHGARRGPAEWCCWMVLREAMVLGGRRRGHRPAAGVRRGPQHAARCSSTSARPIRWAFLSGAAILLAVAAVAAYLPAYRASRIEPMVALNR